MNILLTTGMKTISILLLYVASATALFETIGVISIFQKLIDDINSRNTSWKAGNNFDGADSNYLTGLLGVHEESGNYTLPPILREVPKDLPDTFDARERWKKCTSIGKIRDQGSCASCWALVTADAISDRICIHSNAKVKIQLSTEDLLTCCGENCGYGCKGGYMGPGWQFWVDSGIVTGDYNNSGCKPYSFPPCRHSRKGDLPSCGNTTETPKCVQKCQNGHEVNYKEDRHFGGEAYSINQDVKQIQSEIFKHGPVVANFMIYEDFFHYKSGVYQKQNDKKSGLHAVKLIGWGTEGGVDYWLATNSWNENWGDNGYLKIRRGTNECNLEEDIFAGLPKK